MYTVFENLIAATPPATAEAFDFGRIQSPLDLILPLTVFVALAAFAVAMYARDCRELGVRPAVLLSSLRILALLGLLAVWLQPQWRSRRDVVDRSRVLLLADTSQSMQRRDAGGEAASLTAGSGKIAASQAKSRSEAVVEELSNGTFIPQLRQVHDVLVYGFDEGEQPALLATFPFLGTGQPAQAGPKEADASPEGLADLRRFRWSLSIAGAISAAGIVLVGVYLFRPAARGAPPLWLLLAGALGVLIGIAYGAWMFRSPGRPSLLALLGLRSSHPVTPDLAGTSAATPQERSPEWRELLAPRGAETRLAQAVYRLALDQRNAPVAGMIVMSDGAQNAGISVEEAAAAAREARIAVHAIGVGSRQETASASWASFEAHDRAMPGDPVEVKARVRAVGLAGRSVTARLRQVPLKDKGATPAPELGYDQQQELLIGGQQENLPIKFDIPGIKTPGRYAFQLSLEGRGAAVDPAAAQRNFQIEIADRKTKVLVISGGPGREYRFLRSMLRRDKQIDLDTWLQSSTVEKSKDDYPRILTSLPEADQLKQYDCIIAIDPDWTALDEQQASHLADWVDKQAGGLIVVAGRVFAGGSVQNWLAESKLEKIRKLYPVDFPPVLFQADDVGRKWTQARPIDLTRAGMEADFLRLADNPSDSQRIWNSQFEGVYATLQVRGPATGATVYARHADPLAEAGGIDPIFLAERFVGAGRVFYVGTGELWRLRQVDERHFERFYAQLIDHVSKQRQQRGQRGGGMLLLDRNEYQVGETVPVTAEVKNVRDEPLAAQHVALYLFAPQASQPLAVKLLPDPARKGIFVGQFVARQEGNYRLELALPEGGEETVPKTVRVTTSAREADNPQRNDDLLGQLARTTGGRYYIGIDGALGRTSESPLLGLLKDRTQTTPVMGDKDSGWDALWARLAMFGVCGALALEWLLRRLMRLA